MTLGTNPSTDKVVELLDLLTDIDPPKLLLLLLLLLLFRTVD